MRNVFYIAKRELTAYFVSAMAYAVGAAFLFITGVLFYLILLQDQEASLRFLQSWMAFLLLVIAPILTMRLLAEEHRSGTLELLLTFPVRDGEVVAGKFLAAFLLMLALVTPTLTYLFLLAQFGNPDVPAAVVGFLGVILLGGAALAIGVLTSTVSQNQIVAAMLGIGLCLALWFLDAGANVVPGSISPLVRYLSFPAHYLDWLRGIVDSSHLVYFVSVIWGALFLATRVLEGRRWR
jgi:ABC-2 type transport system permease protein